MIEVQRESLFVCQTFFEWNKIKRKTPCYQSTSVLIARMYHRILKRLFCPMFQCLLQYLFLFLFSILFFFKCTKKAPLNNSIHQTFIHNSQLSVATIPTTDCWISLPLKIDVASVVEWMKEKKNKNKSSQIIVQCLIIQFWYKIVILWTT